MRKFSSFLFFCTLAIGISAFSVPTMAGQSVGVSTFKEFYAAIMDQSVTDISVKASFVFENNILAIPNRDVTINGNADKGVVINSTMWTIYGNQNELSKNTFSIINANIVGRGTPGIDALTDGRFFTGGVDNGPNAKGWDVYAKDVKYVGARFVHISNGTLTLDGTNEIYTNCENAWVDHVVFKAGSTYKSSNSGTGDYGAFYFNKGKGIADGTAILENGAKTYFNIGTYAQPVFTGDVYKTVIGQNAVFDVNTLGHAIWYAAGSKVFYQVGNPEFTVESGAVVNIKQVDASKILKGNFKIASPMLNIKQAEASKAFVAAMPTSPIRVNPIPNFYVPVYFAKSGEPEVPGTINIEPNATFYVSGKTDRGSNEGVIKMGTGSVININNAADFDIRNNAVDAPAITPNFLQKFTINLNSDIRSWEKTQVEGFYDDNKAKFAYSGVVGQINIDNYDSPSSQTNNVSLNRNFVMKNYGRIALRGGVTEYTVKFDSQGGSSVQHQVVSEGERVMEQEIPSKENHIFMGWSKDSIIANFWEFSAPVYNDMTLFAIWEEQKIEETYSIIFNSNGGTPVDTISGVQMGTIIAKPINPTKKSSVFYGWYTDKTYKTRWNFNTNKVTENLVLYALWNK